MKALTLWQPWATLIALGEKQYETRSWAPDYRGQLAIHAGKLSVPLKEIGDGRHFYYEALEHHGIDPLQLPLKCVLCIVELRAVYRTADVREHLSDKERAFGDYSDGRAAWLLEVVEVLSPPIWANGKQGLWNWERDR